MAEPRKVAVFIGSKNDFAQCVEGFQLLREAEKRSKIKMLFVQKGKPVNVNSIHRHPVTRKNLKKLLRKGVDCIIAAAGKAAHLPGMLDSIARYELKNDHAVIYAAAFRHATKRKSTQAAIRSIDEVPGTQVVFTRNHVGTNGFTLACKKAVNGKQPKIKLPTAVPDEYFSLEKAIAIGLEQRKMKE